MNVGNVILSKMPQEQKDKYCVISYVESKTVRLIDAESRMLFARRWWGAKKSEEMLVKGYKVSVVQKK